VLAAIDTLSARANGPINAAPPTRCRCGRQSPATTHDAAAVEVQRVEDERGSRHHRRAAEVTCRQHGRDA